MRCMSIGWSILWIIWGGISWIRKQGFVLLGLILNKFKSKG